MPQIAPVARLEWLVNVQNPVVTDNPMTLKSQIFLSPFPGFGPRVAPIPALVGIDFLRVEKTLGLDAGIINCPVEVHSVRALDPQPARH